MRIGIDLGGTKTEVIGLDKSSGEELYRHRIPTPKNDYKATVKAIIDLVDMAEKATGRKGTVGIGIPGTVSEKTGLVKNANSVWLNGQPLKKDLEEISGREIRIQNDANCFAVSEATDGAAAGKRVVFGVIIGTGCGGGVAIDGKAIVGVNGIAGEWGHNPLPMPKAYYVTQRDFSARHNPHKSTDHPDEKDIQYTVEEETCAEHPGLLCYCGRRGCLETLISGPGFSGDYERVTGKALSSREIIEAAEQGDGQAVAALDRYMDRLARGLSGIINILDPDTIVLGGGMSNVSKLYECVPEIWKKYVFSDTVETELLPPRFGDSSGIRGAAWLWND